MNNHFSKKRGFTIIETLVSLSILAFSILGLIVITSQGIADTNFAKNKLVASSLAQEGIEMVRNMRDSSMLGAATWQDTFRSAITGSLSDCFVTPLRSGCDIDPYTFAIRGCATASRNTCGVLRYDRTTGAFRSDAADFSLPQSQFTRIVSLRDISQNEVEVTSTVHWTQGTALKTVAVTETLFNWVTIAPVAPPAPSPTPGPTPSPTPNVNPTPTQVPTPAPPASL